MKILVVSDRFPPWSSRGAERIAAQLAGEYARAGHEVVVVHGDPLGASTDGADAGPWRSYWVDASGSARWRGWRSIRNRRALRQLEPIVARERPGVVHAHNLHEVFSFAALEVLAAAAPVVLTLHDCMSFHQGKFTQVADRPDWRTNDAALRVTAWDLLRAYRTRFVPRRAARIRRLIERSGAYVVALSHMMERVYRVNRVPCHGMIRNGVQLGAFDAAPDDVERLRRRFDLAGRRIAATFGRLTREKGRTQMLGAMRLMRAERPEAVLFAVGTPPDLLGAGAPLAVGCQALAGRELAAAYALADVVVVPSVCLDVYPTVVLEAMAAGKPTVVSSFAGSSEVVEPGRTGCVVDPLDTRALADAVSGLLDDPDRARRFGLAARHEVAAQHTIAHCAGHYLALFERLAASRGA